MAIVAGKRSVMTLYSGSGLSDINSHRVRIVLAEKDIGSVAIITLPKATKNELEDLAQLNPENTVPTLVDRELVLYEASIISEYLDERFPHPPLLPVYPIARAKARLTIHHIERDWYKLVAVIQQGSSAAKEARKALQGVLVSLASKFNESKYFLGDDFSLVDCCIAPLLWRLPSLSLELPKTAQPLLEYAKRLFERDSFRRSMTDEEKELRMKL